MLSILAIPPHDYTQPCNPDKICTYNFFTRQCTQTSLCTCPPPLPNSTLVYNACAPPHICFFYNGNPIGCQGNTCLGNCYYKCNPGFVWNGSKCAPTPKGKGQHAYLPIFFTAALWQAYKRKRKKVAATLA